MTFKQEKIEALLQTINVLYESQDTFVNDNYDESSCHCPNVGHPLGRALADTKKRDGIYIHVTLFCKILIAEML